MESIDEAALERYLAINLGGGGLENVERIEGGAVNETFGVSWNDREFVLRRPSPSDLAPGVLGDLRREYDILDALEETDVPAPRAILACEDLTVIGSPFYLQERLDGDICAETLPKRFQTPEYRHRVGLEVVEVLVRIHGVDTDRLQSVELPTLTNASDVQRSTELLEWALERTGEVRDLPRLRAASEWLASNAPETESRTLVHGDYTSRNVAFEPMTPPQIQGVFDWEQSAIADPLTDLGFLCGLWHEGDDPTPFDDDLVSQYSDHGQLQNAQGFYGEQTGPVVYSRHPDCATRRELVERYESLMGIQFSNERFYRAQAVHRVAAIVESFYRAHLADEPTPEWYVMTEVLVPAMATRFWQVVDGDLPL
jgi:aminoglycoside phosphotransferase (APT) family kinase protein